MHITRVELENIKSHENFAQSFERGTTAITDPDGSLREHLASLQRLAEWGPAVVLPEIGRAHV